MMLIDESKRSIVTLHLLQRCFFDAHGGNLVALFFFVFCVLIGGMEGGREGGRERGRERD